MIIVKGKGFSRFSMGLLFSCILGCGQNEKAVDWRKMDGETLKEGKALALNHCQSCHLYPEPDLLDQATWKNTVLPKMGHFMGVYQDTLRSDLIEGGKAMDLIEKQGIFPKEQKISDSDWEKITAYYLATALTPGKDTLPSLEVLPEFKGFEITVPDFRNDPPMTTLVSIDDQNQRIFVGDAKADVSSLTVLDYNFSYVNTIYTPAPPSGVTVKGDSLLLTMMGRVLPTDNPSGQIINAFRSNDGGKYDRFIKLADQLQRPVNTVFADLTNNGLEDIIVCEFGNYSGSLSWFENTGVGYAKHVLLAQPGALKVELKDMNGDGLLDIIALMGQGDESIWVFTNQGNGRFKQEQILRFLPTYGVVNFELADINQDGFEDIILSNGDNGDYYPVLKAYHGIRIFENDGNFKFKESHFFPFHGAYKATAVDFDQDGDLDILGISFYPDFSVFPNNSIIYLENEGEGKFVAQQIKVDVPGRWITFDVGDLDGDGDLDVLLGSYTGFPTYSPDNDSLDHQLRKGNSLLVLKNLMVD